jgi:hypothetical protein
MAIMIAMPTPKISAWPKFSQPSEVQTWVAEIFDRLEIQKRIDRLGVGLGVAVVHRPADGDAPVARPHGEPDVEPDGDGGDGEILQSVALPEDGGGQQELDEGRHAVEDREAHDRLDALGAALDDAREAAGAPLQMETQRQAVQVHEGTVGELAHGILPDAGEKRVAKLVEPGLQDARAVIGKHQHDGAEKERRQQADGVRLVVQRIGRPFEEIGHEQQHDLGGEQEDRRPDDPHLQVRPVARPHIGPQVHQRVEEIAVIGRNRLLRRRCHAGLRRTAARPHVWISRDAAGTAAYFCWNCFRTPE